MKLAGDINGELKYNPDEPGRVGARLLTADLVSRHDPEIGGNHPVACYVVLQLPASLLWNTPGWVSVARLTEVLRLV